MASDVKEERLVARRKRVETKLAALRREAAGEQVQENEEVRDPEAERKSRCSATGAGRIGILRPPPLTTIHQYPPPSPLPPPSPVSLPSPRHQVVLSEQRLEKLVSDGTQLVSNVVVAGDSKEVQHRVEEEEALQAR